MSLDINLLYIKCNHITIPNFQFGYVFFDCLDMQNLKKKGDCGKIAEKTEREVKK